MVISEAAKRMKRQYVNETEVDCLDSRGRIPFPRSFSPGLFTVPISDSAVERPDRWVFGSTFVSFGHADFGRFGVLDGRTKHPDVADLDSLLVEMPTD